MTDTEKAPLEPAAKVEEAESKEIEDGEIMSTEALPVEKQISPEPKHPLEHGWTFWFDNPNGKSKQATWGSSLRPVYTFKTVEDFWCLYNNVLQPSQLVAGADFHCFKEGIEPKWEDPKCAQGGKWSTMALKGSSKSTVDAFWLHTLLAMIGEQFEEYDDICGAVVSVRTRQEKIALWTKTASNEAAQLPNEEILMKAVNVKLPNEEIRMKLSIGKQWKQVLDISDKIGYLVHEDARRLDKMQRTGTKFESMIQE